MILIYKKSYDFAGNTIENDLYVVETHIRYITVAAKPKHSFLGIDASTLFSGSVLPFRYVQKRFLHPDYKQNRFRVKQQSGRIAN